MPNHSHIVTSRLSDPQICEVELKRKKSI